VVIVRTWMISILVSCMLIAGCIGGEEADLLPGQISGYEAAFLKTGEAQGDCRATAMAMYTKGKGGLREFRSVRFQGP